MNEIKDGDILYRYALPSILPEGQTELPVSIFNDTELSCDWDRYQSCPASSPHVLHGRKMVVSIQVCEAIRNPANPKRTGTLVPEWKQEFVYDPLTIKENDAFTPNKSHSLISGKKKIAVTTAIRDNSTHETLDYVKPVSEISSVDQQQNVEIVLEDVLTSK